MSVNTIDYRGNLVAHTGRNPSPNVWADAQVFDTLEGNINGTFFHDEFNGIPLAGVQTTEAPFGGYKVLASVGNSVSGVGVINSVAVPGGVLRFQHSADNGAASLARAYPSLLISGLTANSGKLWFEARIAVSTLAVNGLGFFLGLAEVDKWTLAAGVPFNGGDAITNTAAAIGFRKGEDALGVIDTVYSDRATAFTNIQAGAVTLSAANTFIKLGMVYDPNEPVAADCLKFYADNLQLQGKMSRSAIAALTNLDSNPLGLIFATVADTAGTTAAAYLDWWRVAQLLP